MKNTLIKYSLYLLIGCCSIYTAQGQNQATINKIDNYLNSYMDSVPMPGFSVVIVEKDKVLFQKGYGVEEIGQKSPMSPQSAVGISDLTMSMTAMAMMQLVEKGQVALDDKVINYLPWFQTANKEFSDQITIRMLLSHTSGIPSQFDNLPSLNRETDLEDFVRSMNSYYINKTPGLSYGYSREGFCVAGLIISKVTGMSYAAYMEKNVFQPLEMRRTTTDLAKMEQLGVLYGHDIGLDACMPTQKGIFDGSYVPAGSEMRSTAEDLGHYLIALLNGGKYKNQQIVSSESIEELWTPQISFNGLGTMLGGNGITIEYGLGWLKMNIDERDLLIHPGNTGTMSSITGINRANKTAMAILFNADSDRFSRFAFPSIQNIGNNILHLLANEAPTDFAMVRFDDPYDEFYDLPKADFKKYMGQYVSIGDAHPIYKDFTIDVFAGANDSLELKAYKEEVLKGHFKLQFSSLSRAVLRGIVHPREIQFKLNPNGAVTGVFIYGSEFKKKDPSLNTRFSTEKSATNKLSFLFPADWQGSWQGEQFIGKDPTAKDTKAHLEVATLGTIDFPTFLSTQLGNQTIVSKGLLKKEAVKDGVWMEQSICTETNGQLQQHLLVLYQHPLAQQQVQLVVTNPWGEFTNELQELVQVFQGSVGF